jgi:tetratricopeptide (TPR) repeat protein
MAQATIWGGSAAIVAFGLVQPYRATMACRAGDQELGKDVCGALNLYERASKLDPGNDQIWVRLANAAMAVSEGTNTPNERSRYANLAAEAMTRACELVPINPFHHANLGQVLGALAVRGQGDRSRVYSEFDAAIAADPNNVYFYLDAGKTALMLGDIVRANEYASRGDLLYPDFAPTRAFRGTLAFAERRWIDAGLLLTESLSLNWRADEAGYNVTVATLAEALLKQSRFTDALTLARSLGERAPDRLAPHLLAGAALEGLGQKADAAAEYRAILASHPTHSQAQAALVRLQSGGLLSSN